MWLTDEQRELLVESGRLYIQTYCRLAQVALGACSATAAKPDLESKFLFLFSSH